MIDREKLRELRTAVACANIPNGWRTSCLLALLDLVESGQTRISRADVARVSGFEREQTYKYLADLKRLGIVTWGRGKNAHVEIVEDYTTWRRGWGSQMCFPPKSPRTSALRERLKMTAAASALASSPVSTRSRVFPAPTLPAPKRNAVSATTKKKPTTKTAAEPSSTSPEKLDSALGRAFSK